MKTATIVLAYHRTADVVKNAITEQWSVERITDSLEYHPGQYLSKKEVDSLCRATGWKVTIQHPRG